MIADSIALLRSAGFADSSVDQFAECVIAVLDDYAELLGEGTAIEYTLKKKFSKVELRMQIPGAPYDIFTNGSEARKRQYESLASLNNNAELARVSYRYLSGRNVVCVSLPLSERRKPFYKSSMFLGIVLGIVLGYLCLLLPEGARSFLVDDVASPVMSTLLSMIAGVTGPVIFISIITSIVALESVNDLTHLAFRILKRFVVATLFMMFLSVAVSVFFFRDFGTGEMNLEPSYLVELILSVFPTNIVDPFLNSNIPQLVVLGILLGSALLLLGEKVAGLKETLMQINQWAMTVMKIFVSLIPLIPFLSLLTTIGSGNGRDILKGWKFIAAAYIVLTVGVAVKALKTSLITGISIPEFFKKIRPTLAAAFAAGTNTAAMHTMYEVSDKELGIKPEFTSFWVSMWSAMLSLKTAVYVITATLLVAEMSGMAMTTSFLFTMLFVTLELSLASPGATAALVIMFTVLGISTDYVGLFSIYRVATDNYCTACAMGYSMLEQKEAAHRLGGEKESQETLRAEESQEKKIEGSL